ncbi:MAG TPA: hypothetical protein VIK52_14195 [Opitutaceae bacterium]
MPSREPLLTTAEREAICDAAVERCCRGPAPIDRHDVVLAARCATLEAIEAYRAKQAAIVSGVPVFAVPDHADALTIPKTDVRAMGALVAEVRSFSVGAVAMQGVRALEKRRDAVGSGSLPEPIPMCLWCPGCHERHVDAGEFATKPHHTHACQRCGMVWRPAVVPTVGVQFLPGFSDAAFLTSHVPASPAGQCDAVYHPAPGVDSVRCDRLFEHNGKHHGGPWEWPR